LHCVIISPDVQALEGYADALTEVGGLTSEHHKAIATKLALDIIDNLKVPDEKRAELLQKETKFINDAEMTYVRSKYMWPVVVRLCDVITVHLFSLAQCCPNSNHVTIPLSNISFVSC
jgi:hypothetical protein